MSLNPLAVGFLASIHRMVEMQTQGPKENHPTQDISAALAGLGASSGSSNLVPNPLLNCLNQVAQPEIALNNNYRSVSMAHKRANLERKIAAMRRQKEEENADCLPEQKVDANPLVDFSRVLPDESSDADVELLFRKGLQLMLSEQTDLFNFAAQTAEEALLKMSEAMEDSSSQKTTSKSKGSRKRERKVPCTCEICGKKLASSFQLKEHISIQHLNERNFGCEHCGTKFGRRGGLRRHVQMVHLNQTHRCPYEGCVHPGYKCSKALAAHIRSVHTNQRPYECEHCQKSFVRRNDLKMHEMTHNKTISFGCVCGSRFRRQIYLKKHQKNCQIHATAEEEAGETEDLMDRKEISTMDTDTDDLAVTKNIADIVEETVVAVESDDAHMKPEDTVVEEEDPTTTTKESD